MKKINLGSGFTLIELLVVVAIVGILTSIILTSTTASRNKGADAGVKANLKNAMVQGEVFYATNTAVRDSYTDVCSTTSPIGGASTVTVLVTAAAKIVGLSSYARNPVGGGTVTTATCNDSATAWAVEVPLRGSTVLAPNMWCVDSLGKSKQKNTTIGVGTACN